MPFFKSIFFFLKCFAGFVLRMKNWVRVTFAIEPSALEDGLERIQAFCLRHAIKK